MAAPYRLAMVVGLPRSGTTFLQIVLGSHPDIVTSRETHLFDRYLGPMFNRFACEEADLQSPDGIRLHIGHDTLIGHVRTIASSVFASIHAGNPGAQVVLEKTPGHLAWMKLIHDCFPEIQFIHIVRDPRGVVASRRAVGKEAWGGWAKGGVEETAHAWSASISDALAGTKALGDSYRQVRYEDLFANGATVINELYQWLGLSTDPGLPRDLRERFPIAEMARNTGDATDPRVEPRARFFRRGDPQGWQDELSNAEIATIEKQCAETMVLFGYVPQAKTFSPKSARLAGSDTASLQSSALLAMTARLIAACDFVYYCDVDDGAYHPAPGLIHTNHSDDETDTNFMRLANGNPDAKSGGKTGGYNVRTPDAFETAASGHRIAVSVIARAAGAPKSRFALAYSTNEVGNSGWRWQDTGPEWTIHTFEYDVPVLKKGNGDFIGILPDRENCPGVDVFLVTAHIRDPGSLG